MKKYLITYRLFNGPVHCVVQQDTDAFRAVSSLLTSIGLSFNSVTSVKAVPVN
jgi:hypothetical protein